MLSRLQPCCITFGILEKGHQECTCSLRRLPGLREEATRTAVTLVMKDSMGSTVSFVTAMMNTSQVALSSFSSSFLLSICDHGATIVIAGTTCQAVSFGNIPGEVHPPLMRLHQSLQDAGNT